MASREPGGERKPLDAHHASNGSHPSAALDGARDVALGRAQAAARRLGDLRALVAGEQRLDDRAPRLAERIARDRREPHVGRFQELVATIASRILFKVGRPGRS
jgi:hypothetical protein